MNSNVYKWCAVPLCKNTSKSTPDKLFVYVPTKKIVRDKWLKLARRNPSAVVTKSSIYFCEDHFDLPNDMENYMQYHVMGSVSKMRMKSGCIPTKFTCQPDRKTRTSDTIERPYIRKKRKILALEECEKQLKESSMVTEHIDLEEIGSSSGTVQYNLEEAQPVISKKIDKSVQVHMTKAFRSKATQTQVILVNQMTSPLKPHLHSVSTSPFKINHCVNSNPSSSCVSLLRRIECKKEQSDSDSSYTPSVTYTESSLSTKCLQMESPFDCSVIEDDKKQENLRILDYTLNKIKNNPHSYIGVPISCYHLINLIQEQTNIPSSHILLCLKKIRLNASFRELADEFAMNKTYATKLFKKKIPILASVISPFIVKLDKEMIKRNLPIAFRHKYNKVSCIIDCIEIEEQKPSNALN